MTTNLMNTFRTKRRGVATAAAVAALGLTLAGCGENTDTASQQPAAPEAGATSPAEGQQTSPAAAPTSETPTTQGTTQGTSQAAAGDDDIPASTEVVNTAIDTAVAQVPNSVAYDFEYDDDQFEIDVTDGQSEREITIDADGTTVVEQDNDDLGDFLNENREEVLNAEVDMKQAIQVALNQQAGIPTSAELDKDRNLVGEAPDTLAWDVEIAAQDGTEADVVVDAVTTEILSTELDR